MSSFEAPLAEAIQRRQVVRLGYLRRDGVLSLHRVAPVDIRPGETERTRDAQYLWAYCLEEDRLEMHVMERVRSVTPSTESFDAPDIMGRWPRHKWPIPSAWVIERDW